MISIILFNFILIYKIGLVDLCVLFLESTKKKLQNGSEQKIQYEFRKINTRYCLTYDQLLDIKRVSLSIF
jgi:hypothetical protein